MKETKSVCAIEKIFKLSFATGVWKGLEKLIEIFYETLKSDSLSFLSSASSSPGREWKFFLFLENDKIFIFIACWWTRHHDNSITSSNRKSFSENVNIKEPFEHRFLHIFNSFGARKRADKNFCAIILMELEQNS